MQGVNGLLQILGPQKNGGPVQPHGPHAPCARACVRHKFSLSGQDVREGWVNGRFRKGNIVVAVVIATRTISTIPLGSRTQHHPVNK